MISVSSTLPVFEVAFPDRFVRDGVGVLTQIDTRPLNTVHETRQSMSLNANLSGPSTQQTNPPQKIAATASPAMSWNASLSYSYTVKDKLDLKSGIGPIDLLTTQVGVSANPSARHRVSVSGGMSLHNWNGDISLSWRSGASATSAGNGTLVTTHTSALYKVDASLAAKIGRNRTGTSLQGVRLRLSVQNLFDARPSVYSISNGRTTYVQPWRLDPMGRTVTLSLQRAF